MSTKKPNREKKAAHRRTDRKAARPDFNEILHSFCEAFAIIHTAAQVIDKNLHVNYEGATLRQGVEALDKVYNDLDQAIVDLSHHDDDEIVPRGGKRGGQ
jgi:hypothetical protein